MEVGPDTGPEDASDEHLRLLARLARIVSPEETLAELRRGAVSRGS